MPLSVAPLVHCLLQLEHGLAALKSPAMRRDPVLSAVVRLGVVSSFELSFDHSLMLIANLVTRASGRACPVGETGATAVRRAIELGLLPADWNGFLEMRSSTLELTGQKRLLLRLPAFVKHLQQLLLELPALSSTAT